MHFINDPNFTHPFFKDVIRIDYSSDMPTQIINDYGYSYIMLCYGKFDALDFKDNLVTVPRILTKGTGDYFRITAHKDCTWITFEVKNHVLHNITNKNVTRLRNKFVDFSNYIPKKNSENLFEELKETKEINTIVTIADKYLSSYYTDWDKELSSTSIVNYIYQSQGLLSVNDILDTFSISKRTLERLFNKEVGASPHRFICLVRFNYIIRKIQSEEFTDLLELIDEYNYYDKSHFEKDFKKFMGQTLKDYKNTYNPLLTNALARAYIKD